MQTTTLILPERLSGPVRALVAWLAALAVALACAATTHAAELACPPSVSDPTVYQCDLYAQSGTYTPAGAAASLPVFGYGATAGAQVAQPGGPTLVATEGVTLSVIVHNELPGAAGNTSLSLHGQGLAADLDGVAAGGVVTYTFQSLHAGTFLYQAGLTENGPTQAAMGLYGVLVVKPAAASPAYNTEAVVLLSEIDPDLNQCFDNTAWCQAHTGEAEFQMGDYSPKYWLINGQGYAPATDTPIAVTKGDKVLLRYANAGFEEHSMGLLGLSQQVVAQDSQPLPFAHRVVAETVPPGSTLDTIVDTSAPGAAVGKYPLFDGNQHLNNNTAAGLGGMLTFLEIKAAASRPAAPVTAKTYGPAAPAVVAVFRLAADAWHQRIG